LKISGTSGASATSEVYFEYYGRELEDEHTDYHAYVDWLYWDSSGFSPIGGVAGTATSTALDFGRIPIDYGNIFKQETLNNGTITYETQTSGTVDFSMDNDSWRTVSWVGNVGTLHASTVMKRYLRWRLTITIGGEESPEISEVTMPGSILFDTTDCTTDLYSYGNYDVWSTLNSQQIKSYSFSSADDSAFGLEVIITGTTIGSTTRRYIKFRNIISKITNDTKAIIHRNRFLWNIQSFNAQMANFTDLSVQQAIENLAFLINFEIGITALGKYFFRSKDASTEVDWAFEEDKDIIKIVSVKPLWEKVFNRMKVEYGNYVENSDALINAETRPNTIDKYGEKFLRLGGTNVFIHPDVNIAKGMIETYYNEYKDKGDKKEVVLDSKAIFQLDLGDTVSIDRDDLTDKTFKVVGINLDIENWSMQVVVWEN